MDEIRTLEELLRNIVSGLQNVLSSGEQISDEVATQANQVITQLVSRIKEIEAGTTINGPAIPPLQDSMPSSNISAFAYDPKNQRMFVRFLGKYPNRQGPVYSYEGVPPVIFKIFQTGAVPSKTDGSNRWGRWWKGKSPSMGATMNVLLKHGGFPYARMT